MLRAVSVLCGESQSFLLYTTARRDAYKLFRNTYASASTSSQRPRKIKKYRTTVLTSEASQASHSPSVHSPPPAQSSPPPTPPSQSPRRSWTVAAALALTASVGGIYFFRKLSEEEKKIISSEDAPKKNVGPVRTPIPASADQLPRHVQFLLVGAGTASFAAMRAIRSQKPDAQVLMVGSEYQLPYMRPPLTKELWREPDLDKVTDLDSLTFKQWNGRVRSLAYEPSAFYTPVEQLEERGAGCGVARGWAVRRLDVARRRATLEGAGGTHTLTYDYCLVATGVVARRSAALAGARGAGRARTLRTADDVTQLAARLAGGDVQRVAVLGGGLLATELSAALAARLKDTGKTVLELYRESSPLASILPSYLAEEAARRLQEAGVTLLPEADVVDSIVVDDKVLMRLASGAEVEADYVVECVGTEFDPALADASELEVHPELGGVVVNPELQARPRVWAAGSAACHWAPREGRRRGGLHDHAVTSGRRAGDNMLADMLGTAPAPYTHPHMFWTDLGPDLGYEAIGTIDSKLKTVGVFSEDAVTELRAHAAAAGEGDAGGPGEGAAGAAVRLEGGAAGGRRYERGVVFYLEGRRVVGVLLWNLFNRMHVARQVLAQAEFEDLFEVAKLFALHEDE
uniref:Apoptosis-inducing factor 1, mitochondrial n=1 Tax=Bombyx mori TaxID=7091 RepID=A0A8R2R495_BOMMO|nr:apoptosis-inducing factor 1, mitochondrial isoform X1 [Bombyx mori]